MFYYPDMTRVKKHEPLIIPGSIDQYLAEKIIKQAAAEKSISNRIITISSAFLGIPYKASTIDEHSRDAEQLVIDFSGVDCFTLLDYVESMRRSSTWPGFIRCLRSTRYKKASVLFKNRNHFFSDWVKNNTGQISDITKKIASDKAAAVTKTLNLKNDGSLYIQNIKPVRRRIMYIPPDAVDQSIQEKLRTGDYAGIYSDKPGLDVSHVGIIIRTSSGLKLRHASSSPEKRCVLDEDLLDYISRRQGLVVYRPV
ncbi:MAG: DUF1460 domain-containing protein [Nitrospirae bacterium]|nr:DUF1460 domain-containing protein [Nitrospirota bacterium]